MVALVPYLTAFHGDVVEQGFGWILIFLFYPSVVLLCVSCRPVQGRMARLSDFLAGASFHVYLWHLPLLVLTYVLQHFTPVPWLNGRVSGMLLFLAVSVLFGALSYRLLDRPVTRCFDWLAASVRAQRKSCAKT